MPTATVTVLASAASTEIILLPISVFATASWYSLSKKAWPNAPSMESSIGLAPVILYSFIEVTILDRYFEI
ncbi:hypothetical protein D3C85_1877770 [compost metagenome]